MILNRRNFFAKSLAAAAVLPGTLRLAAETAAQSPLPRMKDLAAAVGLRFGADSDSVIAQQPPAYALLFAEQCALYAANLSWSSSNPQSADATVWEDPNIAFARAHGQQLTGGHLAWYRTTPQWLAAMPAKQAEAAIVRHTGDVAKRYGGELYSWNIVNEAIAPEDGRSDGLRKTIYQDKFGLDYFDFTAHAAAEAAPKAIRVYNDYAMEMDTPENERRRRALIRLLDEFRRRNTPIQAIGLQSHVWLEGNRFDEKIYRKFLTEIGDRGFPILITELDVYDYRTPSPIEVRDRMVADMYSRLLHTALDDQGVKALVVWGLSDAYTWLNPRYDPHYKRGDGQPSRPLPFDAAFQPKPAFTAIVEALRQAPVRSPGI